MKAKPPPKGDVKRKPPPRRRNTKTPGVWVKKGTGVAIRVTPHLSTGWF